MKMERVRISETPIMEPSFIWSCYLQTDSTSELTAETAYKLISTVLTVCNACPEERRDFFFRNDCIMLFFCKRDFISHHKCHSAGPTTQRLITFSVFLNRSLDNQPLPLIWNATTVFLMRFIRLI